MSSLSERSKANRQKNMEGVNMPASPKFAWRWIVGTTAAAMLFMAALPSAGHADTLTICVNGQGKIKGINVACGPMTALTWETVGEKGNQGPQGVQGPPGFAGPGGASGIAGIKGPTGAQGANGPTGPSGLAGLQGDQGPQGIQGNPGVVPGPVGIKGIQGIPGINGTAGGNQFNKSFLTGGSLGTFGANEEIALSGLNSISGNILVLGPGNGADTTTSSAIPVPVNDPGIAYNLFVNVDNNPGVDPTGPPAGAPITYFFFLCNGPFGIGTCNVSCVITDPDTTCKDTKFVHPAVPGPGEDFNTYIQGDQIALFAFSSNFLANTADVKWSATYEHNSFVAP
jgi:Collagen triple helix repeat (20 copies)